MQSHCPSCGAPHEALANFCGECGRALKQPHKPSRSSSSGRESQPTLFGAELDAARPSTAHQAKEPVVDAGRTLFGSDLMAGARSVAPASVAPEDEAALEKGAGSDLEPDPLKRRDDSTRSSADGGASDAPMRRIERRLDAPLRPDLRVAPEETSTLKKRRRPRPGQNAGINPDYLPPEGASPKTGQVLVASRKATNPRQVPSDINEERKRQARINERVSELDLFIRGSSFGGWGSPLRQEGFGKKARLVGGVALAVILASIVLVLSFRGGPIEGDLLFEPSGLKVAVPLRGEGAYRLLGARGEKRGDLLLFPISMSALDLGENLLKLERRLPDGQFTEETVRIDLPFHLAVDPKDAEAVLSVRVAQGSLLSIDGKMVELDTFGRGIQPLPELRPDEQSLSLDLDIHLKTPRGEILRERYPLRLRRAPLRLATPGEELITEADRIVIRGSARGADEVRLDGEAIPLEGDEFRIERQLPHHALYEFKLEVFAPERLPTERTLRVERVRDRGAALDAYPSEEAIAYAELARDPARYRGKRQTLEGLVYQIERRGGATELQVLSRNCPTLERCPLWVSYGEELDIAPYRWIAIAGQIAGTRRIRDGESGEVVSIPRLSAAIIAERTKEVP